MTKLSDLATTAVEAFAGGTLAGLAVGFSPDASIPWNDALLVGVGCAIIAVLLALATGPIIAKLRPKLSPVYKQQIINRHEGDEEQERQWPPPVHTGHPGEPHIPHVQHVEEQAKPTEAEKD